MDAERLGNGGDNGLGIEDGREVDEPYPVLEVRERLGCHLQASLFFPVPPGPVSVSSRTPSSIRRLTSDTCSSRPMNFVSWRGRLFGRTSSPRIGGNSDGSPGTTS